MEGEFTLMGLRLSAPSQQNMHPDLPVWFNPSGESHLT